MAPDPAFAFVGGLCCPTLDFVYMFFGTMILTHCLVNYYVRTSPKGPKGEKLILQGYNEFRLKSPFRKFYGRYIMTLFAITNFH